jgi:hypothetical protein
MVPEKLPISVRRGNRENIPLIPPLLRGIKGVVFPNPFKKL